MTKAMSPSTPSTQSTEAQGAPAQATLPPKDQATPMPTEFQPSNQNVVFTGHNSYLMSVARVCREANKFTDVTMVCHDGVVVGHRLVLGAASTTLRAALQQVSPSPANDEAEPDTYTVIVPDVKKNIVASLVDFLYTGKLIISPSNSRDMQLLVRMLGIDPDNVRVEALEESAKKRMVQSQLTASMGLMTHNPSSPQADNQEMQNSQTPTNSKANKSKSQVNGEDQTVPSVSIPDEGTPATTPTSNTRLPRASKRRHSLEKDGHSSNTSTPAAKEPKLSGGSPALPMAPIGSGFGVSSGSNKKPSRPPQPVKRQGSKANKGGAASQNNAAKAVEEPPGLLSGYHDMSNVETWVCAICHLYDPATDEPGGGDDGSGDTTEWIGCDCNRWYHKFCTGLAVVDETFCCAQVKLTCLPPSPTKK